MKFFRPEIETVFKMAGAGVLVGLVVLPMAWAYEQRQQARAWQKVACAYRMRELAHRTPLMVRVDAGREPCLALQRLGLDLDVQRVNIRRVSGR